MKVINLLMCHKLIFVVNMPEKIVTPNDILVAVFCKSGRNVYLIFAQKNKNAIKIKIFFFFLWKNTNLKQY